MRTAEVQFSEIKLIWSLKHILGRWDGGRLVGGWWYNIVIKNWLNVAKKT